MGYGAQRFVSNIDENLLCGVCSAVLEEAVLTPCGHSFCRLCLATWLARPGPGSCPECRGKVAPTDSRPVLSIRNLINSLEIHCEHHARGCEEVLKLDSLAAHLETCRYAPIECAACGSTLDRSGLADHHVQCSDVITSLIESQDGRDSDDMSRSIYVADDAVSDLACRVTGLEIQVRKIKTDLDQAREKNSRLEQELTRTREHLVVKRHQLMDQQYAEFDPSYQYGYAPGSIVRLACLIARFLLKQPPYVNADKTYECVKRCYDNYGRCNTEFELDVLMLLATANASNWFNKSQKVNIQCWLQCLNRYKQYKHDQSVFK